MPSIFDSCWTPPMFVNQKPRLVQMLWWVISESCNARCCGACVFGKFCCSLCVAGLSNVARCIAAPRGRCAARGHQMRLRGNAWRRCRSCRQLFAVLSRSVALLVHPRRCGRTLDGGGSGRAAGFPRLPQSEDGRGDDRGCVPRGQTRRYRRVHHAPGALQPRGANNGGDRSAAIARDVS